MSNRRMSAGTMMVLLVLAVAAGIAVAAVGIGTGILPTDPPVPTPTTVTVVVTDSPAPDQGQEIIVDEYETNVPNVTPPDTLSLIMHDTTDENGDGPLDRCHDYGGDLTLDMICHGVDY